MRFMSPTSRPVDWVGIPKEKSLNEAISLLWYSPYLFYESVCVWDTSEQHRIIIVPKWKRTETKIYQRHKNINVGHWIKLYLNLIQISQQKIANVFDMIYYEFTSQIQQAPSYIDHRLSMTSATPRLLAPVLTHACLPKNSLLSCAGHRSVCDRFDTGRVSLHMAIQPELPTSKERRNIFNTNFLYWSWEGFFSALVAQLHRIMAL